MNINTSGNQNTAVGFQALSSNLTGTNNIALGLNSLLNSNASGNVGIGYNVASTLSTGANNIIIGSGADVSLPGTTNAIAIGYNVTVASNTTQLGNSSQTAFIFQGSLSPNNSAGTSGQFLQSNGSSASPTWGWDGINNYLTSTFSVASSTSPATITGFSWLVPQSSTAVYKFTAELFTSSNIAGGVKFNLSSASGSQAKVAFEIDYIDNTSNAITISTSYPYATTNNTTSYGSTATTAGYCRITGILVTTNTAQDTWQMNFSQNASSINPSNVLAGSTFVVTRIN